MKIKFQLSFSIDDARTNFNANKDSVYLSGSSKILGCWNLNHATEMKLKLNDGYNEQCSLSLSSLSLSSSTSSEIYADNL